MLIAIGGPVIFVSTSCYIAAEETWVGRNAVPMSWLQACFLPTLLCARNFGVATIREDVAVRARYDASFSTKREVRRHRLGFEAFPAVKTAGE